METHLLLHLRSKTAIHLDVRWRFKYNERGWVVASTKPTRTRPWRSKTLHQKDLGWIRRQTKQRKLMSFMTALTLLTPKNCLSSDETKKYSSSFVNDMFSTLQTVVNDGENSNAWRRSWFRWAVIFFPRASPHDVYFISMPLYVYSTFPSFAFFSLSLLSKSFY